MSDSWLSDVRASYDADAEGYTEKVQGLLAGQPYLLGSLALFADVVRRAGGGPVADIGCGPGYVTRHLCDLGVDAFGIDLSPEMIATARRDHPGLHFEVGDMTHLDLDTHSLAGVLAFWSVVHVPDHAVPRVFDEFRRVVRPGGAMLIGFHVGDDVDHTSEGYSGRSVAIDTYLRPTSRVEGWLRDAGFTLEATLIIRPDGDTPGAVVFARSGSGSPELDPGEAGAR